MPNGQRFSGIWVDNRNQRGWTVLRNLTLDESPAAWEEQFAAGNRVIKTSSGTEYLGIYLSS